MKQYYAVIWGNTKRWTGEKVSDEAAAKHRCFGMMTDDMVVVGLGTRKQEAIKALKTIPYPETEVAP